MTTKPGTPFASRMPDAAASSLKEIADELVRLAETGAVVDDGSTGSKNLRPPLTDHDLANRALLELQWRRKRNATLGPRALLGEPTWELLLDLFINQVRRNRVTITSACIAAGVPITTALRYINALTDAQLLEREPCNQDRRAQFLRLTSKGSDSVREALINRS